MSCPYFGHRLKSQPIRVAHQHHLATPDGQPYFWLGDTAWELFHRLDRNEATHYLQSRAAQGFNIIQAVALYEIDPFEAPNAYGDFPLNDADISSPAVTPGNDWRNPVEYDYYDHMEFIICEAIKNQLILGLLPCWGEYVTPRFRDTTIVTKKQGYDFGWFIGSRFKSYNDHIVWILGGDRLPDERKEGVDIWRAIAEGITDAVNEEKGFNQVANYSKTFMTYHCYTSSSIWFHDDDWIDMHTWGSYHEKRDLDRSYKIALKDWQLNDPKPTLNSEPAYEMLPINYDWERVAKGRFDDFDVRQQAYWSVFSGACGHTYGCNPVWQMYKKENPHLPLTASNSLEWHEALYAGGAQQMKYLKELMLSAPDFFNRKPITDLVENNAGDSTGYVVSCGTPEYCWIYIPTGKLVKIKPEKIPFENIVAYWYSPFDGSKTKIGEYEKTEDLIFDPPGPTNRGNDWVLILESE